MSRITSDILGMMGQRALADSRRAMSTAMERLSTGKRINRASDDPSGMAAATNLSAQAIRAEREIAGLELSNKRLDATEGGLGVMSDLLAELQGVVVSAANTGGMDKAEREALQIQASGIIDAINYASNTTIYNNELILEGYGAEQLGRTGWSAPEDAGSARPEQWADESDEDYAHRVNEWENQRPAAATFTGDHVTLADLGEGMVLNLVDGDMEVAQKVVQAAADQVSRSRADMGAKSNSNRSRINALSAEFENTMAAKSAIEDTDFAKETSEYVRTQILGEASIRAILIGQQQRMGALALL